MEIHLFMVLFLEEVPIEPEQGLISDKKNNWIVFFFIRLFIRGIDDDGRVANFVETEQILQLDGVACSYVQVKIDWQSLFKYKSMYFIW